MKLGDDDHLGGKAESRESHTYPCYGPCRETQAFTGGGYRDRSRTSVAGKIRGERVADS